MTTENEVILEETTEAVEIVQQEAPEPAPRKRGRPRIEKPEGMTAAQYYEHRRKLDGYVKTILWISPEEADMMKIFLDKHRRMTATYKPKNVRYKLGTKPYEQKLKERKESEAKALLEAQEAQKAKDAQEALELQEAMDSHLGEIYTESLPYADNDDDSFSISLISSSLAE